MGLNNTSGKRRRFLFMKSQSLTCKQRYLKWNDGIDSGGQSNFALEDLPIHGWRSQWGLGGGLEGVERGSGKLGRECPPPRRLNVPFRRSQRDPSSHTTHTLLFSPGDRSGFLFHTQQANIKTPTSRLMFPQETRSRSPEPLSQDVEGNASQLLDSIIQIICNFIWAFDLK